MAIAALLLPLAIGMPFAAMDTAIDGLSIEAYHESKYDARKKVYLYSSGECDGAHRRLTLSTDFSAILKNEGFHPKDYSDAEFKEILKETKDRLKNGTIKGVTNRSVKLGMTPAQVTEILGTPAVKMNSSKFNAYELIYKRNGPKDKEGLYREYKNYYLFRGNKLFYIELANDLIGGGC